MSFIVQLLKKNQALQPLFITVGAGVVLASLYVVRLAIHPHTVWKHTSDPYPWLHIKPDENIKFMTVNHKFDSKDDHRKF